MTNTPTIPDLSHEVASTFIDALVRRDFAGLAALVSPDAQIRALTPRGLASGTGPAFLEERFSTWFGGDDEFAVEDSTVSTAGRKVHLCWRISMTAGDGEVRKAEQHAFVRISDRIESFDLVCSGYWPVVS